MAIGRDHGGNLDAARRRWGGEGWIDLSTGINRQPYPVGVLDPGAWRDLPTAEAQHALLEGAASAWQCRAPMVALAGAQAVIQLLPRLVEPADARRIRATILAPTYNEYRATLLRAGCAVAEVGDLEALAGADLAIVVNPNNPDGRSHPPERLLALAAQVGRLVVDESFADPMPGLSLLPHLNGVASDPLVLRSFGKFYGLAGLRLGFAAGPAGMVECLTAEAGPWPVCGPAIEIGTRALADREWAAQTTARLTAEAGHLDKLAAAADWPLVGGTALFRLYQTPDAVAAQERLARARIWSRIFPWHPHWLRLGLPGGPDEWDRLATILREDKG